METLIIHLEPTASKAKVKEALKMLKEIATVSEKITRTDIENLADEKLIKEMKKGDKPPLLSYEDGIEEFQRIKKSLR